MEEAPKRKKRGKRRLFRIIGSMLSLAVLTYIAVTLITGRPLTFFGIFGGSSDGGYFEMVDEYYFDVGRSRVFADLGGSLAAAGTLGIQVLDAGGQEALRDSFRMATPAICALGGRAVSFDVGGTSVRVFDKSDIIAAIETDLPVISASINRDGLFAVCTQGAAGSRGVVTVYNSDGSVFYRVSLVSGYVLSAALSPDSKNLAVLNLTEEGSRITFYDFTVADIDRVCDLPGSLTIDMQYLPSGEVVAISTESLFVVGKSNEFTELFNFSGSYLGAYALDGNIAALLILDNNMGLSGRLVTIDERGILLGALETDKEVISMSAGGDYVAVLKGDGFVLYNAALEELPVSGLSTMTAGASCVVVLDEGLTLAAGDNSAAIVRVRE